jgi:hypothetical protein
MHDALPRWQAFQRKLAMDNFYGRYESYRQIAFRTCWEQ